jgi:hypothetical protein
VDRQRDNALFQEEVEEAVCSVCKVVVLEFAPFFGFPREKVEELSLQEGRSKTGQRTGFSAQRIL